MIDHAFKALQIKARQEVYTYLSGNHLSKLLGEGYDFSTLLEYQLGDDIRRIDWIASAKLQKPYVKHFSTYNTAKQVFLTARHIVKVFSWVCGLYHSCRTL